MSETSGVDQARNRPLSTGEIVRDELARVCPELRVPQGTPAPGQEDAFAADMSRAIDAHPEDLAALCLSGGGIRSAAFALGALQGLAKFGALGCFHYLSTVSGGGYIGAWLTAWRHHAGDDARVFSRLNQLAETGEEADEIAGIRADSNYLTPRLGLLSPDTWGVLAMVVRNITLNWLVFAPFFLGVLFIPLLALRLIEQQHASPILPGVVWVAVAGLFTLVAATTSFVGRFRRQGKWLTTGRFVLVTLPCATLAAASLSMAAATPVSDTWPLGLVWLPGGGAVYVVTWLAARSFGRVRSSEMDFGPTRFALELAASALTGACVGAILRLGIDLAPHADARELVVLGILWGLLAIFVGDLIYVGLTSFLPGSDMDREWLARASGLCAAVALSWSLIATIDLYGPGVLGWLFERTWRAVAALSFTGACGLVTVIFGAGSKTAAFLGKSKSAVLSLNNLVILAGLAFAACLAAGLAGIDARLDTWLLGRWPLAFDGAVELLAIVVLVLAALLVSVFVNVNRFSLHALYRNRLVRAFLGSARAGATPPRRQDPFTGFDQRDDVHVGSLGGVTGRLLHVVNVTLNVVSSNRLAWQERKAEPFTVTPLACGNPIVGYRPTAQYGGRHGLTLGTAMAISGAAVSPNMGYHSSPVVSFLLMLFNVRLGWWLGNPRHETYRGKGPRPGLIPALMELAGATTDDGNWLYLSDGGHFDNLGLYEMVRRRCRIIVVSDAGADPHGAFDDLGSAVRKIFIDQGVGIDFERFEIKPRSSPPESGVYCAMGTIRYPGSNRPGWLLYIKPGYHGDERFDIRSYATGHADFPHESTANQWYSESQFEAYRALGAHVLEAICGGGDPAVAGPLTDFADLRRRVGQYLEAARTRPA